MRNKKTVGDDVHVREDVLKMLGKYGLTLKFHLISNIYQNGEWPKNFTEVTMTALKNKPKATNCSNHCTSNLIAHTANRIRQYLEDG